MSNLRKSLLALLIVGASGPVFAQTTLSLSGVLPFDANGFGAVRAEGGWQWQRDPFTLGASVSFTAEGWKSARLCLSYKISSFQANANTEFTPQGLKSAGTQLKLELKELLSLENTLSFEAKGFKSGTIKFKAGPSALNATGSAKLTPTGFAEPAGSLNFSLSFDEGDVTGTTNFDAKGFKEQSLSATGYITDDWTLTMTSILTLDGLKSQSFELSTRLWDGNLSLSVGMTVEGRGITSETLSADLILDTLFVQLSLDFAGLEFGGLQAMANGSVGPFSLDVLAMLGLDGIQFAQASLSGSLFGFSLSGSLDMSPFGLGRASLSLSRSFGPWTFAADADFGLEGFEGGSLRLSRTWKFP